MSLYYQFVNSIDTESYTDYFLNSFLSKYNVLETIKSQHSTYIEFDQTQQKDKKINELNEILVKHYKFPAVSHFLIFYHNKNQSIHADGSSVPRWCSFNLPIMGWKNTIMNFYSVNSNSALIEKEARYYKTNEVSYRDHFECSNNWVLVNSGVPHNVSGMTIEEPRVTLVVRFRGNPSFILLQTLIKNYHLK